MAKKKRARKRPDPPVMGYDKGEALGRLRRQTLERLAAGELVRIALPGHEANPWKEFAGIWKDHPDFDEFVQNIAEHRRSYVSG